MHQYLYLAQRILNFGDRLKQRAVLASTNSQPDVLSLFGERMCFNLAEGFPLLTTKRVWFKGVVHELLWFMSGSTNVKDLHRNNVHIWDQWADADGELGPVYGQQWRRWQGPDGQVVDQINKLVHGIRKVKTDHHDSEARRLILSSWNPADVHRVKVPFCHTMAQFVLRQNQLSCQLYQRSADLFLGVPWNTACYALLTHLLARVTGVEVGNLIHVFGDVHIYENHVDQIEEQITRTPRDLPQLELTGVFDYIDDVTADQIHLAGYDPYPALKGEVAI